MDTTGKVLDVLFRQIAPERILHSLKQCISGEWALLREISKEREKLFIDFAESTLHGYSENEQRMLYGQLEQERQGWEKQPVVSEGFLSALIQYGQETLVTIQGIPYCRNERVLSWRDVYLRMGQDAVVCPYLAYRDFCNNLDRVDFTWPAILKVHNNELSHMLEKGMAENHNHINGGTQSFQITWCRLMNYPEKIRTELKNFRGNNLRYRISRGEEDNSLDRYEQLELAALFRTILFRAIHRKEFRNASDSANAGTFSSELAFKEEYMDVFSLRKELCDLVDCLRTGKGSHLDYPDEAAFCLDYVLSSQLLQYCADSHERVLVGERCFLYQCALQCMRADGFTPFEQELFYLYLLLKSNFRSEMIQANGQTGFQNFLYYQNRKDDAWDENPYFWEAARMAINYRLSAESVTSLEGRLVPKPMPSKNIEKVYRFDLGKRFADCTSAESLDPSAYNFDMELDVDKFTGLPYFFVYHFVKTEDDRKLEKDMFWEVPCRHKKHRENLRAVAIGLGRALRKSTYLRNRMRGIDASASEIGCRPEVFAAEYRYLDAVQHQWNAKRDALLPSSPMRISKTYHAGEDFLDIADGLRAIDEAVSFLDLGVGSRIGHALAMGVPPEEHYRLKNYEIVTSKQDRLDDLVWLLYRTKELGVRMEGVLESRLRNETYQLFREIYGAIVDWNGWNCELLDYYHSMQLRCDEPSAYYPNKKAREIWETMEEFDQYLLDRKNLRLREYRKSTCVSGLYYYYHYGAAEGICGRQKVRCKADGAYIRLMRQVQDAMQRYIDQKRIVIECNPSSNVLIGTFQRYEHHPIFRFNNRKLQRGERNDRAQLQVCVNTDDLGIFDTSLDFEYALLEQTLRTQEDEQTGLKYGGRDIMEYLDDLRRMGLMAVFPENSERGRRS